jgi:hypothetical protein
MPWSLFCQEQGFFIWTMNALYSRLAHYLGSLKKSDYGYQQ